MSVFYKSSNDLNCGAVWEGNSRPAKAQNPKDKSQEQTNRNLNNYQYSSEG